MAETANTPPAVSELDPELVRLPRARTRVRPIMALAIIAICVVLGIRLISDLQFSRQSTEPVRVASLAELGSQHENHYVEIELIPDRPQAMRILPTGSSVGELIVPALGSRGKLWVLLPATPWAEPHATNEVYQGRLMRLRDMSFFETLRDYLREGHNMPRPIELSEVRKALSSATMRVADIAGDTLAISAETPVRVHEVALARARVYAVSSDPYDHEAAWQLALNEAGILPPETSAVSSDPNSWTFEVPAPEGVQAIRDKLAAAKLFAARAEEIVNTRTGTWEQLSLDGEDILLGTPQRGFRVERVALGASLDLPADAFVLSIAEEPKTYWYVLSLVVALGCFVLLFGFGLYRSQS